MLDGRRRQGLPGTFQCRYQTSRGQKKYYHARGSQVVNCVVDISSFIDQKIRSNMANIAQGPAGNHGKRLRERLAKENKKLPIFGNDDQTANYQYVKQFCLEDEKKLGKEHGLEFAEAFHYIGPRTRRASNMQEYIEKNAVPL